MKSREREILRNIYNRKQERFSIGQMIKPEQFDLELPIELIYGDVPE